MAQTLRLSKLLSILTLNQPNCIVLILGVYFHAVTTSNVVSKHLLCNTSAVFSAICVLLNCKLLII